MAMHGMICKALEGYLRSVHGDLCWHAVRRAAGFGDAGFEGLRCYDDAVFRSVLTEAALRLKRPEESVLEDVGGWLCTHPPLEPVRRLLRFCGSTFRAFLFSLEEVEARGRMALPELALPACRLRQDDGAGQFLLDTTWSQPGGGALVAGVLRAMADDHGTLAMIETTPACEVDGLWCQAVSVELVEEGFQEPKSFALVPCA